MYEPYNYAHSYMQYVGMFSGVYELFAGAEVYGQLTVVTLSQKPRSKTSHSDVETEQLAKQFLLAAQDICSKLKMAG